MSHLGGWQIVASFNYERIPTLSLLSHEKEKKPILNRDWKKDWQVSQRWPLLSKIETLQREGKNQITNNVPSRVLQEVSSWKERETRRTREVVGGEEKRRVRRKKALQSQHFGRSRVIYAFNTRSSHSSGKKKIYIYILIPTSFKKLSRKGGWSRLVRMEGEESGVKASHQLSRGQWKWLGR